MEHLYESASHPLVLHGAQRRLWATWMLWGFSNDPLRKSISPGTEYSGYKAPGNISTSGFPGLRHESAGWNNPGFTRGFIHDFSSTVQFQTFDQSVYHLLRYTFPVDSNSVPETNDGPRDGNRLPALAAGR